MNARFLKLAVLTGLLALGAPVSATSTDDTVSGSYTGTVFRLGTINNTYSDLFISDASGNGISCQGIDSRFYIARAHTRHQQMFDNLVAAKLSGRSVEVHYQLVSNQCWVKRVIVK
jgi:hypothetical protein